MAYTTINKPTDHFNTLLYVGNGSDANSITGVGFKPDWVWTKNRDHAADNYQHDIVRGVQNAIRSNNNSATYATSINLQSFDSDGFTLGTQDGLNKSGDKIVSWNWLAGGSQGSSNTDGSINTTYTSANTTSGFSISQYTGDGSTSTVGHGLGVIPKVIIIKGLSNSGAWQFYHEDLGNNKKLILNTNAAESSSGYMNNTSPTSSVFTVTNDNDIGTSGYTYVAYAFAEKTGFSKFSSYTGNGQTNGAFINTGFKPAWVMVKRYDSGSEDWRISDNKRDPENVMDRVLFANLSNVESDADVLDFLSNGFKLRTTDGGMNAAGGTYVYMAFAEAPFVGTNNIPCTAR